MNSVLGGRRVRAEVTCKLGDIGWREKLYDSSLYTRILVFIWTTLRRSLPKIYKTWRRAGFFLVCFVLFFVKLSFVTWQVAGICEHNTPSCQTGSPHMFANLGSIWLATPTKAVALGSLGQSQQTWFDEETVLWKRSGSWWHSHVW